uniref:Orofacial cleft 1 candidate gene 1 protein n=1 Tax=Gasterosteus aculeatus aculeatus TaxID=481459 RepID=A0AAQ4RLK6_GASAC
IHLTISLQKLQQKALQQPKQKKSKSAEFLMGREQRDTLVGIENPAFDGGGGVEISLAPPAWLGREIRGDRPDSTLAAHPKKMELRAAAKERATLNADENRLYHGMSSLLDEEDTFINIPGTLPAFRDEEVLEVKAGDPVLEQRLLLHSGGEASGSGPSQTNTAAKTQAGVCKKPIKKTNSRGPSVSGGGGSAPHLQAEKQKMQPSTENLSKEEMEEFTFSLHSAPTGHGPRLSRLSERARLALSMLPSELGLPLPGQQRSRGSWRCSVRQLGLIMLLLALMWFVRLYLHYCSQWLYLQAIAVPVNKFQFHAHTVDLVYQSSLLHTREELAMVVAGPLTLNAVTFLLVLIRWGCQQMFGSLPSFTSKFIMAQGVWTVLDPLAVFAVDAVLGRLAYSPDTPVGDAAKLYWHFYRVDQSGAAGVIITLFLYTVLFLLSTTILSINILRFHNDGRMLDVFQRLTATEGKYFLPQDLELSNQELSYIVKKAEQWRGFNGERRKVAVYDYICTVEDPLAGFAAPTDLPRDGATLPEGETSTHVAVYTLYLSGLRQRYRHFLRQPDGAIVEVGFERLLTKKEGGEMSLRFRKHSLFSSLPRSPLQEGEGRNGCKE